MVAPVGVSLAAVALDGVVDGVGGRPARVGGVNTAVSECSPEGRVVVVVAAFLGSVREDRLYALWCWLARAGCAGASWPGRAGPTSTSTTDN